jgi:TctA family transporter
MSASSTADPQSGRPRFRRLSMRPLAPFTLALVLGNLAEHPFRLSMIGFGTVFSLTIA